MKKKVSKQSIETLLNEGKSFKQINDSYKKSDYSVKDFPIHPTIHADSASIMESLMRIYEMNKKICL